MLLFREEFEIAHPTAQKFERMIDRYRETYEDLETRVEKLPATPESEPLKKAARSAMEAAADWWKINLEASQFATSDPDRADRIYREGIEQVEDPRLLGNYALFLQNVRKDFDRAEEYYKRALELDPESVIKLGNYALFLQNVRKDFDRAEEHFKRALELDPEHANNLGGYAIFLQNVRKDFDRAEEHFKRALELDPEHANNLGNYALFLEDVRKDFDRAEEHFKRALELDPESVIKLGNYAVFLKNVRKDFDQAEEYYKRALELDPEHADNLGNYAIFLKNVRKDFDRAEEYYKRVLELDSEHANSLGNYGQLLLEKGEDDKAWELIEKSMTMAEKDPLGAELWFYVFALDDDEPRRMQALGELIALIKAGVRSPSWDFSGIVSRAREQGHPDIEWIQRLSEVISEQTSEDVLDDWSRWHSG